MCIVGIQKPTPVQDAVIPFILKNENLVMAASTGSGKTLAYLLPIIQNLQKQEQEGFERQIRRPRCLVLVPTRELARQVLSSVKQIGHISKISSSAVLGGESYSIQKKSVSEMKKTHTTNILNFLPILSVRSSCRYHHSFTRTIDAA